MLLRLVRFVDWRFVFAFAFLTLVVSVGLSWRATALDNQTKAAHISALITQSEKDHRLWDAERDAAARERARLLVGQQQLASKYDRLVDWLNSQHITVPEHVTRIETRSDDDGGDDPGSSPRPAPSPAPKPSPTSGGGGPSDGGPKSDHPGRGRTDTKSRGPRTTARQ